MAKHTAITTQTTQHLFQQPGEMLLNRAKHVWIQHHTDPALWKCVLCGGLSRAPSNTCTPLRYERLTDEERALCKERKQPNAQY